jgi:hypothetical protein
MSDLVLSSGIILNTISSATPSSLLSDDSDLGGVLRASADAPIPLACAFDDAWLWSAESASDVASTSRTKFD